MPPPAARIADLLQRVTTLEAAVCQAAHRGRALVTAALPARRASVANLIHYLALRQFDLRDIHADLADLGLSSLGRAESHVLGNLQSVRGLLQRLAAPAGTGGPAATDPDPQQEPGLSWATAEQLLHEHTRAVLGAQPPGRHVYIMVTAPALQVADNQWFNDALAGGMNVLRINTAHGSPDEWVQLADRARDAARRTGTPLRILADLPGPKLRTTALEPGPRVLRVKPRRDLYGRVARPAWVRLVAAGGPPLRPGSPDLPTLVLPAEVIAILQVGDRLCCRDAQDRRRHGVVTRGTDGQWVAVFEHTVYVTPATPFRLEDRAGSPRSEDFHVDIPALPASVTVKAGSGFVLASAGGAIPPDLADWPAIGCAEPAALVALEPGQRVFLDDGKVHARVERTGNGWAALQVERSARNPARLRADLGINLPDTQLDLPAIADHDAPHVAFAAGHADIVGLSFVRSVADVRSLEERLAGRDVAIMLKIETQAGFAALPGILLDGIGRRRLAVMIARGDLAVECGFERLAELQEEILWLCEASHVPVVWATQVLETLAKTGFPTRAEITDAAMAVRAECVMLNKGPFIGEAIRSLDSILRRMETHQYKKRQIYRPLRLPVPDFITDGSGAPEPVAAADATATAAAAAAGAGTA